MTAKINGESEGGERKKTKKVMKKGNGEKMKEEEESVNINTVVMKKKKISINIEMAYQWRKKWLMASGVSMKEREEENEEIINKYSMIVVIS